MEKVEFIGKIISLPSFFEDFVIMKEPKSLKEKYVPQFFSWKFVWNGKKEFREYVKTILKEGEIVKITIEKVTNE